jgi:hypothetical protein
MRRTRAQIRHHGRTTMRRRRRRGEAAGESDTSYRFGHPFAAPPYGRCVGVEAMNLRCFNPQFFIASKFGDAALRPDRAGTGGAYDRDLGIVIDALRALSAAVPTDRLLRGDRLALERLEELAESVRTVMDYDDRVDAALSTADVDDLIGKLRRLRQDDPSSADRILRRITEESGPDVGISTTG